MPRRTFPDLLGEILSKGEWVPKGAPERDSERSEEWQWDDHDAGKNENRAAQGFLPP